MRRSRALFTSVAAVLVAAGCARSPAPSAAPSPEPSASDNARAARAIPVEVDNENFYDMNVYLLSRGARYLIGQVGGMTKATLTVPAGMAPADNQVRLRAEAIGGAGATTTPLLIVPQGQQVFWTIGADPSTSFATAG